MPIFTHHNCNTFYTVEYIRTGPDGKRERDCKRIQAPTLQEARKILRRQLAGYQIRDSRWSYELV